MAEDKVEKKITDLSVQELKALGFDLNVSIQTNSAVLKAVLEELRRREAPKPELKPEG